MAELGTATVNVKVQIDKADLARQLRELAGQIDPGIKVDLKINAPNLDVPALSDALLKVRT